MKLEGIRVLDLSNFLPGPLLSLTMADHGAEVIKIEQPGEGDRAATSAFPTGRTPCSSATTTGARRASCWT